MLYDDVCYDEYIVNLRVYVMQIISTNIASVAVVVLLETWKRFFYFKLKRLCEIMSNCYSESVRVNGFIRFYSEVALRERVYASLNHEPF